MRFWIVTPSYNQIDWLKTCLRSVADQSTDNIFIHHHVQDACSTDGTVDLLKKRQNTTFTDNYSFSFSSEKDEGMYDAINIGWEKATDDTDVIAHLNCDEQYLPQALKKIAEFFELHQNADVVLADMIVVDNNGSYICHRRSLKPYSFISKLWCAGFTATTFQRAYVTKEKNVFFDTKWKNIGDKVWYNSLHAAKVKFAVCHEIVSIFTDTGENLNWTVQGKQEGILYMKEFLPLFKKNLQLLKKLSKINALRRWWIEQFCVSPTRYSMFKDGTIKRVIVESPTWRWGKKAWNK